MATKAIVGEKVGMTQVWDEQNRVVPVTMVKVAPCRIVQVKTPETDGYAALQVTFGQKDPRKLTQPKAGHFEKANVDPGSKLVERSSTKRGGRTITYRYDRSSDSLRVDVTLTSPHMDIPLHYALTYRRQ